MLVRTGAQLCRPTTVLDGEVKRNETHIEQQQQPQLLISDVVMQIARSRAQHSTHFTSLDSRTLRLLPHADPLTHALVNSLVGSGRVGLGQVVNC